MNERLFERVLGLAVITLLIGACLRITAPFFGAMTWAIIISVSIWPLYLRLRQRLSNRGTLAAVLISLILLLAFVMPTIMIGSSLGEHVGEVTRFAQDITSHPLSGPPVWLKTIPVLGEQLETRWLNASQDMNAVFERARPLIAKGASWLISQGAGLTLSLLEFFLAVVLGGLMLAHGEGLARVSKSLALRLSPEKGSALVVFAEQTIRSVTVGVMGTALIQGVLTALGLWLAGIPGVALLGLISFLLAMLQIGTGLVWIPAAIWLGYHDQQAWMIFMIVWGIFVNTIDNFIKPYLIGHGGDTPMIVIFLGVLGGLLAWGLIGIFIGSTLLAVTYKLLQNWLAEKPSG